MSKMNRLNIVHICDHLGWPGSRMHGVKRLFSWMIPRFDTNRFNVTLISLRKKDLSEETLEQFGIEVTYLGKSKFDPMTLPALLAMLDRKRADVLHLHGFGATTFGRLAAAWRRWPVVLHEHSNSGTHGSRSGVTKTPWFQKLADALLAPYTDLAIAASKSTAQFVVQERRIPTVRTKVVYLGAPLEEFGQPLEPESVKRARDFLGITPKTTAVGTVTRLMPPKGNRYLVAAARYVLEIEPSARFYIVGEGELRSVLEAQAHDLGVADRVTFTGYTREVAAAFAALDVVVFPSLWEGTPLTAFEALAMGKPIVASATDGLTDILTHNHDALLVPKADSRALAKAILELLHDSQLRERLGRQAQVTSTVYDVRDFVRKMERLYTILHETSRRTSRAGVLEADLDFLSKGIRL